MLYVLINIFFKKFMKFEECLRIFQDISDCLSVSYTFLAHSEECLGINFLEFETGCIPIVLEAGQDQDQAREASRLRRPPTSAPPLCTADQPSQANQPGSFPYCAKPRGYEEAAEVVAQHRLVLAGPYPRQAVIP